MELRITSGGVFSLRLTTPSQSDISCSRMPMRCFASSTSRWDSFNRSKDTTSLEKADRFQSFAPNGTYTPSPGAFDAGTINCRTCSVDSRLAMHSTFPFSLPNTFSTSYA